MKEEQLSPLVEKYQKALAANPNSLVFAPLAECYRRLGMLDMAVDVLRSGIKRHPHYVLGHLGLAHCFFDQKKFDQSYTILRPWVESSRDNLRLQKLFGDVCLELAKPDEALETFKYLLFMNPRDREAAQIVSHLENETQPQEVETKPRPYFKTETLNSDPSEEQDYGDEWVQKDLTSRHLKSVSSTDDFDQWSLEKNTPSNFPEVKEDHPTFEDSVSDERVFFVDDSTDLESEDSAVTATPLITHTLVDLYLNQGYFEKACELLEKILELNPSDKATRQKYEEVRSSLLGHVDFSQRPKEDESSEQAQREHLMSLIDSKVSLVEAPEDDSDELAKIIEDKLWLFHKALKKKSKDALSYKST